MTIEPVQVMARWEGEAFSPRHFIWRGHLFPIESTGRHWEDDQGFHILCMVPGDVVFELLFRLNPASWWAYPPTSAPAAA
jgi:hypothetical protein